MFNISQFKENVKVVRPNMFYAEIIPPSGIINTAMYDKRKFKFRCESVEIPGRTVATSDDQSFGPSRKFAYDMTYNDLQMTIIASDDMAERYMFETWLDNIVQPTDLNSGNFKGGLLKYYDTYAKGKVKIYQLIDNNQDIAKYELYDAYPIQLSPMNLTWNESDTYQRFSVTMTYRYYTHEFTLPIE